MRLKSPKSNFAVLVIVVAALAGITCICIGLASLAERVLGG